MVKKYEREREMETDIEGAMEGKIAKLYLIITEVSPTDK